MFNFHILSLKFFTMNLQSFLLLIDSASQYKHFKILFVRIGQFLEKLYAFEKQVFCLREKIDSYRKNKKISK